MKTRGKSVEGKDRRNSDFFNENLVNLSAFKSNYQ